MRFLFLSFLCFISYLNADFSAEKVFSISHDQNTEIEILSDVAKGIDNFCVANDAFFLLCSGENQVLHYSATGQLLKTINVPPFAIDLAVTENTLYVITTQEIFTIDLQHRGQSSSFIDYSLPQHLSLVNNLPVVHLANGYTVTGNSHQKGWKFNEATSVFTEKLDYYRGAITIIKNGEEISKEIVFEKELGTILPVAVNGDEVCVRVELVESVSPLKVSEQLITWNINSRETTKMSVPQVQYNFTHGDYKCVNGNLYKMMVTPQGVDIVLVTQDGRSIYSLEELYPTPYHYNDALVSMEEIQGQPNEDFSTEDLAITRDQVVQNAEKFLNVSWRANSKNASSGIIDVAGAKIQTPEWVSSGTHYRMPYKWGGFTSVDTFLTKVSQGKYAGDRYTKSVSWGDTYCVSVDCSGFISRAWNTSQKYGTSTIGQISNQYSYISSLKRGDALNKSGSHIVLVVENNPSGTVNVIESSGIDWAVSKRTRNLSSMAGYVPIYYKQISDGNTPSKGTLKGVIYDAAKGSDSRISGATVVLSNGQSITTGSDGVFSFSVSEGTYTIKVSKNGYTASPISRAVKSGEVAWGSVGMNK